MIHEDHDPQKPSKTEAALERATQTKEPRRSQAIPVVLMRALSIYALVGVTVWLGIGALLEPEPAEAVDIIHPMRQTEPVCAYLEDHSMAELVAYQVSAGANPEAALTRNREIAEVSCPGMTR